ncbi:hypothetical protein RFI_11107, partial [Reticulomyxa filosa]
MSTNDRLRLINGANLSSSLLWFLWSLELVLFFLPAVSGVDLYARLSKDHLKIEIYYEANGSNFVVGPRDIFSPWTSQQLGSRAKCEWSGNDDESRHVKFGLLLLTVQLCDESKILPSDEIMISPNTLMQWWSWQNRSSAIPVKERTMLRISLPLDGEEYKKEEEKEYDRIDPYVPRIRIQYPRYVTNCQNIFLDARSSSNLGGRDPMFTWFVKEEESSIKLPQTSYFGMYTHIPCSHLQGVVGKIVLGLRVRTWYGRLHIWSNNGDEEDIVITVGDSTTEYIPQMTIEALYRRDEGPFAKPAGLVMTTANVNSTWDCNCSWAHICRRSYNQHEWQLKNYEHISSSSSSSSSSSFKETSKFIDLAHAPKKKTTTTTTTSNEPFFIPDWKLQPGIKYVFTHSMYSWQPHCRNALHEYTFVYGAPFYTCNIFSRYLPSDTYLEMDKSYFVSDFLLSLEGQSGSSTFVINGGINFGDIADVDSNTGFPRLPFFWRWTCLRSKWIGLQQVHTKTETETDTDTETSIKGYWDDYSNCNYLFQPGTHRQHYN